MSLLSRLFLLAAFAVMPAIAIQTYNEFRIRCEREVEAHEQALSVAKLAAAQQQQIIQGMRQVLIAMSELPAVKAEDRDGCNAYLATVRERFPAFITFLVTDLNGSSFCHTRPDHPRVVIAHRAYFATVLKTGAFTVGEFSIGISNRLKVIQFALPFYRDDGQMGGVIVAALGLDWLAQSIARNGVPAGASLAIADRNGTYLARYPDNDRFVGRTMPRGRRGDARPAGHRRRGRPRRGGADLWLFGPAGRGRRPRCQLRVQQSASFCRNRTAHAARYPSHHAQHVVGAGSDVVRSPPLCSSSAWAIGRGGEPLAAW